MPMNYAKDGKICILSTFKNVKEKWPESIIKDNKDSLESVRISEKKTVSSLIVYLLFFYNVYCKTRVERLCKRVPTRWRGSAFNFV